MKFKTRYEVNFTTKREHKKKFRSYEKANKFYDKCFYADAVKHAVFIKIETAPFSITTTELEYFYREVK